MQPRRRDGTRRPALRVTVTLAGPGEQTESPVAKDLRAVVCAIRAAEPLERMADLARHIAELARLCHPNPVAPTTGHWSERDRADDRIDRLHREVLDEVSTAEPPCPAQVGIDAALLARYLERFGDQAVSVTGQLDYVATGKMPIR